MKKIIFGSSVILASALASLLFAAERPAVPRSSALPVYIDGKTTAERMDAMLGFCASMDLNGIEARQVMIPCAARILVGRETQPALNKWQQVAASVYQKSKARLDKDPKDSNARNPFEKHALIHAYVLCRDKVEIPNETVAEMKKYVALYKHRQWFGYGALNYRLMNDGAGFIAAELWPDLRDADGLNADGIKAATKERLLGYFEEIVHRNTDEYGAPTYLGIDLSAMKLLADFARDPEVKQRATLTLDSMLLQVACAWNSGYYVTPASRAKYWGSTMTGPDALDTTGAVGWFYFGGLRPVSAAHMNPGGSFWFAIRKDYNAPAIFTTIATERSQPVIHRGSVGETIRFTIYHTPDYSVASEWELFNSPGDGRYKESRRNLFKWISDKPNSTFVPMQENPRRPYKLSEGIANGFGYGENPFAQSLQQDGTLLGISSVPTNYPFWKMYAPFTKDGAIVRRMERDGWVFCHGGTVLFAFRYAQPAHWEMSRAKENCDVMSSDNRKNGWVLETSPVAPFAGGGAIVELDRFASAIVSKTKLDTFNIDLAKPKISYRSLTGHQLELTYRPHGQPYSNQHQIDGKPVVYASFPLFGNPWVSQPLGGDKLILTAPDGRKRSYDFARWTAADSTP